MPSLPIRFVFFSLRTGRVLHRSSKKPLVDNVAAARAKPSVEPSNRVKKRLEVRCEQRANGQVWHIDNKGGSSRLSDDRARKRVVFFHGGGYLYPVQQVHWWFVAHMVSKHRIPFSVALYPLAPEHSVQEFTAFAADLIDELGAAAETQHLVVMGDSAGGGLCVLATNELRRRQRPLPAAMVLICPWLDLDASQPEQQVVQQRDIMLSVASIKETGELVAQGGNIAIDDPLVSPIYGDFQDWPPTLVFGGGDDTLVTDSRRFAAKVPSARYVEAKGQMHVWPLLFFAEARKAQQQIASFITNLPIVADTRKNGDE